MADRGYLYELLAGVAEHIATVVHDDAPLATWRNPYTGGTYLPDEVRPIYLDLRADSPDEAWQLNPLRPTYGPNNGISTPIQFLYRGGRRTMSVDALRLLDHLTDAFRDGGRPLSHHQFGAVRVGKVNMQSSGLLPNDENTRPRFSATYLFSGKRFTV